MLIDEIDAIVDSRLELSEMSNQLKNLDVSSCESEEVWYRDRVLFKIAAMYSSPIDAVGVIDSISAMYRDESLDSKTNIAVLSTLAALTGAQPSSIDAYSAICEKWRHRWSSRDLREWNKLMRKSK
jgi:hypothetical protein